MTTPATEAFHRSRSLAIMAVTLGLVLLGAFVFVSWLAITGISRLELGGNDRTRIAIAGACADELAAQRADLLGDALGAASRQDGAAFAEASRKLDRLREKLSICEDQLPDHAREQLERLKRQLAVVPTTTTTKGTP